MTHCFFLHKITWKDVVIATRLETRQVNEACQGKKPEGGISSAEEIYLNDDVTFDFTFYRFSTVISELRTNSNLYGHNCLCTICTWRTSTPKIVIRANSIADNLLILFRLCFMACMQTSWSVPDKLDRMSYNESTCVHYTKYTIQCLHVRFLLYRHSANCQ